MEIYLFAKKKSYNDEYEGSSDVDTLFLLQEMVAFKKSCDLFDLMFGDNVPPFEDLDAREREQH